MNHVIYSHVKFTDFWACSVHPVYSLFSLISKIQLFETYYVWGFSLFHFFFSLIENEALVSAEFSPLN